MPRATPSRATSCIPWADACPANRQPLPVDTRTPEARLDAITAITEQLKRRNDAASAAVLTQAADWTGGAVLSWAVRSLSSARVYNLIVTNVPGPPVPLYLLGARMRAAYPHLPLFEQQGLGIALLSYLDRLYVGLTADWDQGPLVAEFADDLDRAVADLAATAGLEGNPGAHAPESATASAGETRLPRRLGPDVGSSLAGVSCHAGSPQRSSS